MPVIDKKWDWIKNIVDGYDRVMLDDVIEDEHEIEVDLFPKGFTQDYYKQDNSIYLNECEEIRKEIGRVVGEVVSDFDVGNSWQFLYIMK